jgi:hypothetical protein
LLVVKRLCQRGVGFVRADWRDALVLEIDARRGAENFFQVPGADERRRAIQPVCFEDWLWDVDVFRRVRTNPSFLHDQVHWKERREIFRPDGVHAPRMNDWRQRLWQAGNDVEPLLGHF